MKNADMPAMPSEHYREQPFKGLTKREHIAARVASGACGWDARQAAKHAVNVADALLEELERTS